jgi:hypothetical protein
MTNEEFEEYKRILATENLYGKLLREARESESGAEWYFDNDAEIKAASWYHSALLQYTQLFAYSLGAILGFSKEEVDEQWVQAEEASNEV